ncbi:MAG: methylmalonyl-CoA mutase family protein [Chloroflexi bacterium]|uniref:Methylmalonyl-CoA mutase family protein n=1 Tax=Candidatus Chlorohelix allophototropha TaxID=3003348 RepID=A0A8T7LWE0_9CHLR|nr:methylmalonyl-CoA mutase family protein [Chloroflexota bacterium]WJW66405.1 methylmalonyl-CoA mutase family protein [Chloroflexota bacterium L227-S17]
MSTSGEITSKREQWEEQSVKPVLKKSPERKANFQTNSGLALKRLYTPEDLQNQDYEKELGYPGQYPFTRGVQSTMYRGRFWTMRQYAGFGSAEESNNRYHYLLGQGQTGLSVAFDLPTQMGYDADHSMSDGEVGKVGVSICSLDDMEVLLKGLPLDKITTSMTINSTASVLLALYIAVAKKNGVPLSKIGGTVQNDILKEYVARGTYIYPSRPSMRLITDMIAFCTNEVPNWNTISISGYHIREAGSTAVQEVAFTLANGIAYVEAAIASGQDVDKFASRLSFFFNAHNEFLEEVAKFRAARRLWAKIMRNRFKAQNPQSWMLRFHTQTAGSMLTAQQPENNIVRVTLQALASVLGGTQSLHTNSMDEALALPTEKAVRIALRTQQILAYESGVADTIDPLAGSYMVEALTDEIEQKAQEYLDKIDEMGGTLKALDRGFFHNEIEDAAYRWQEEVETGQRIIVGVNKFATDETATVDRLKLNPALRAEQIVRLNALKARRNSEVATAKLEALKTAAEGTDNLMPYIIDCVENLITLGEICNTLRGVFGVYRPS